MKKRPTVDDQALKRYLLESRGTPPVAEVLTGPDRVATSVRAFLFHEHIHDECRCAACEEAYEEVACYLHRPSFVETQESAHAKLYTHDPPMSSSRWPVNGEYPASMYIIALSTASPASFPAPAASSATRRIAVACA